jgi:hypothetical protein
VTEFGQHVAEASLNAGAGVRQGPVQVKQNRPAGVMIQAALPNRPPAAAR